MNDEDLKEELLDDVIESFGDDINGSNWVDEGEGIYSNIIYFKGMHISIKLQLVDEDEDGYCSLKIIEAEIVNKTLN